MVGKTVTAGAVGVVIAVFTWDGEPGRATAPRAVIRGTVSLAGTASPGRTVDMSTDRYCADARETPLTDATVRTSASGGLRDAVIIVRNAPGTGETPETPVVLDQVGCEYVPRALAIVTGQTLVVRNSDRTLHNVHVTAQKNRGFNIGQPLPGIESKRTFDQPEDDIGVKCDIHGWMHGVIHVIEHPWFAVTDADGAFVLPDLPPGTYTVEVRHETLGTRTQTVTLAAGGATASFVFEGPR